MLPTSRLLTHATHIEDVEFAPRKQMLPTSRLLTQATLWATLTQNASAAIFSRLRLLLLS